VWLRSPDGQLTERQSGKLSTREGSLLAELVPTPKIIAELRDWYAEALLVGWKYEVDGDRASVLRAAQTQLTDCRTNVCVANGPAYGEGFGLVRSAGDCVHCPGTAELFEALESLIKA
jgi:hypothetical protein